MIVKNVFNIGRSFSFVDALAEGLARRQESRPEDAGRTLVLLPNRRSCRNLKDALAARSPGILPRIMPIGDFDEKDLWIFAPEEFLSIPPAINKFRRIILLAELVAENLNESGPRSVNMAIEIAAFLDEVQSEGVELANLANIVPDEMAEHWQRTLDFLGILSQEWPQTLAAEGCIDVVDRRNRILRLQAETWRKNPPDFSVIAAGSTGSVPAAAELIAVVSALPKGEVILPGLDKDIGEKEWQVISESHPQHCLKKLLERIGVKRQEVEDWRDLPQIAPGKNAERDRLANLVMCPSETIENWRDAKIRKEAVEGVSMLAVPELSDEAGVIALIFRAVLESSRKTAALVTNDRNLARMVAARMKKWNVTIDDSAGRKIIGTQQGQFMFLVLDMVASLFSPVKLLAVLKHPLCAAGRAAKEKYQLVKRLEVAALRGARIENSAAGIADYLKRQGKTDLAGFMNFLDKGSAAFAAALSAENISAARCIEEHVRFCEFLAAENGDDGAQRFWHRHEEGEAVREFIDQIAASVAGVQIAPESYAQFLENMFAQADEYHQSYGAHPRIAILSPMEARLRHYDLLIIGEMNQGSWPTEKYNMWMSRQMRENAGLPPLEKDIGLAAHDTAGMLCAPEVVLLRASRISGTPQAPSQWWLRLSAVLESAGLKDVAVPAEPWLEWLEKIDNPEKPELIASEIKGASPPVSARPRQLSATQIEKLMRDPYSIYAAKILRLKPLEAIDEEPDRAKFGSFIHGALEKFVKRYKEGTVEELLQCGAEEMEGLSNRPALRAIWWPRFEKIAQWFCANEREVRARVVEILTELEGAVKWQSAGGEFTLTARADRIEKYSDGSVRIVDYKTGVLPKPVDVSRGLATQLLIEGWILENGGFKDVEGRVAALEYWGLSHGGALGAIVTAKTQTDDIAQKVKELIELFDDADTPYLACPNKKTAPEYNDYEHLERLAE